MMWYEIFICSVVGFAFFALCCMMYTELSSLYNESKKAFWITTLIFAIIIFLGCMMLLETTGGLN